MSNRLLPLNALRTGLPFMAAIVLGWATSPVLSGTPAPGIDDPNMTPNAAFRGSAGAIEDAGGAGTVTGSVPTTWRAFAVGGASLDIDTVPLAANALYPGSPPANAVRLEVVAFGADQGFDHSTHLISLDAGRQYQGSLWVRSGNDDGTDQGFTLQSPTFDANLGFTGNDPMFTPATAGQSWSQVNSPVMTASPGEAFMHLAVRLGGDGGDDSLLIALPEVTGFPVSNISPNPGLAGSAGAASGNVVGAVPNQWRAFAVGDGTATVTSTPLAADALYPGSPATRAVEFEVTGSSGPEEGLDHALSLSQLTTGYRHWGEIYIRSGSTSPQGVTMALPLYDASGTFLGTQPGSLFTTVGPEWTLLAGPGFTAEPGQAQVNMSFRLQADGGEDSIVIALPRIVGPAKTIFRDRFSASP